MRELNLSSPVAHKRPAGARSLACLAALVGGLSCDGSALAEPAAPGRWELSEEAATIDGAKTLTARLLASDTVLGILDHTDTPVLSFSCSKKGLFATIFWPDFIGSISDGDRATVRWKVDDGKVQSSTWYHSEQGVGPMGTAAQTWIRQLTKGKKLIVEVPDHHGAQEATFNLEGIEVAGPKLSEVNCGR